MSIIYYDKYESFKKVRLVSKTLQLDHVFYPGDNTFFDINEMASFEMHKHLDIDSLISLYNTKLFDEIYVYISDYNNAYILDSYTNNECYKIPIKNEWIKLSQAPKFVEHKSNINR